MVFLDDGSILQLGCRNLTCRVFVLFVSFSLCLGQIQFAVTFVEKRRGVCIYNRAAEGVKEGRRN